MEKQIGKVSEISVSYNPMIKDKPTILCSIDANVIFRSFFSSETINLQKRFLAMHLNRGNKVLGVFPVSVGGITGTC